MRAGAALVAALAAGLALLPARAPVAASDPLALEPAPEGLTGRGVAERVEAVFRGDTTVMKARMVVVSPRLPAARE